MSANAEVGSRSTARSPRDTTPTGRSPSTMGSLRTARSRISRTASSTGMSEETVVTSLLHISSSRVVAGSLPEAMPPNDDVAVRDDAADAPTLDNDHVADVGVPHHARRIRERRVRFENRRLLRHDGRDSVGWRQDRASFPRAECCDLMRGTRRPRRQRGNRGRSARVPSG